MAVQGASKAPAFRALAVGAIKPTGWLLDQLRAQADGLTGHLTKFWDKDSWWCGGAGDNMLGERPARGHVTPDLLNGLIPLAWQLDDPDLQAQARAFVDYLVTSSRDDGRFGPTQVDEEPYREVVELGRAKAMAALISYHDVTSDERVPEVIQSYFERYLSSYGSSGRTGWQHNTIHQENLIAGMWLYRRTGDDALRSQLVAMCHPPDQEAQWTDRFREGRVAVRHGYAIAHGLKYPAYRYLLEGDEEDLAGVQRMLAFLDEEYGQVGGRFAAHEYLPPTDGRRPTHGTELCDVVEHMHSLEKLFEVIGDPQLGDRLEALAFNALPATCTGDFWAHQYDQQANQVLVSDAKREFDNGSDANLFGLMPHYICCTGNMHHGWPRFVQHMWMGTPDGGLVACAYGPCEVLFQTADGVDVRVREETEYPFDGKITFTVEAERPVSFPMLMRIPGWAEGPEWRSVIAWKGRTTEADAGSLYRIHETWEPGDQITLEFPMRFVKPESRSPTTVAFRYGPLYLALPIEGEYKELAHYYKGSRDWEISPASEWNVTPAVHPGHPFIFSEPSRQPLTRLPFAARGEPIYDPATDACAPWPHPAPVSIRLAAKRTANWGMHPLWPSAADPPERPQVEGETVEIELVPYGATRLRIAEFPRADRV